MDSSPAADAALRKIRWALAVFILGLVASGVTAFPLQTELEHLVAKRGFAEATPDATASSLDRWLVTVRDGLRDSYGKHPWLAYGTDWLAFAHIVIALFFIGPFIDPVRNLCVLQAGLIACVLVLPLALICGPLRGIPFGWRLLDCSFGVFGAVPLCYCIRMVRRL
jgi:hypothetical protein